jgi:hypothetical protein
MEPACWLLGIWLFFPTGATQQQMETMAMAKNLASKFLYNSGMDMALRHQWIRSWRSFD